MRRSPIFPQSAGVLAALLGAVAFIGWWWDIAVLRSIIPGAAPIKPNIAAGMLLCGAALGLLAWRRPLAACRLAAGTLGFSAAMIGVLTLTERLSGLNLNVDRWLVDILGKSGSWSPGQMSLASAFCFVLAGGALLAMSLSLPMGFRVPIVVGLGMALVVIGLMALGGFALEVILGPQWNYIGMSVSGLIGAIGFMLLGSGLLALIQRDGALTWSLSPVATAGFGSGILLVAIAASLAFSYTRRMLDTTTSLTHRQEVLAKIKQIYGDSSELASRERVFVITGDEHLLKAREQVATETSRDSADLRKLTSDNPRQQARIDRLEPLIAQRIDWEERVINIRRTEGLAAAAQLIATFKGLALSNEINGLLREMEEEEYRFLAADRSKAEVAATTAFSVLPMGVFLSLAILSLGLAFLNAGATGQKQTEDELRASEGRYRTLFEGNPNPMWVYDDETLSFLAVNKAASRHYGFSEEEFLGMTIKDIRPAEDVPALMDNIARANADLDETAGWRHRKKTGELIEVEIISHQLTWLGRRARLVLINDVTARKRAERELQELNSELELRVQRRTAELEAANKELEAFSYSVSHDLRSPLRTVDGFSQAVLEDYGDGLPDEGRRYLQTIRDGAQRMGVLIDDLLTFSRLSRIPLTRQAIDMATMARDAYTESVQEEGNRQIDVKIGELPAVEGDPALLKQVWVNLISNAIKYSRQRQPAVIEVGCIREPASVEGSGAVEENIYFVRDNGTGFDMQYAGKLFGVFQRLHRSDEFEGTGVGLAIVQQVIHRHGGRVWAEAAVDRGATFFFTLENRRQPT